MTRLRRLPLLLLCLPLLAAGAPMPPLLANALPADGSTIAVNPHWLRLYFRTDVIVHKLEMKDADGRRIPLRWGGPEEPGASLEALLPDHLGEGVYDVHWTASDVHGVSEDTAPVDYRKPSGPQDGHVRFTIRHK